MRRSLLLPLATLALLCAAPKPASAQNAGDPGRTLEVNGELSDMFVRNDSLEVIFRNTGRQRTNIAGQVLVRTPNETHVLSVPLDSATVPAGAVQKFRIAMPKLPKGLYVLIAVVDYGGSELTAVRASLDIR